MRRHPGLNDFEINRQLYGGAKAHATINIACRFLAENGFVERRKDVGDLIRNYPKEPSDRMAAQVVAATVDRQKSVVRHDIDGRIAAFIADSQEPCHRYLSWDNCYEFLSRRDEIRRYDALANFAALHLAWFLASWGMLRGAADLLWKNHRFLAPVVSALTNPEFDPFVGMDPDKISKGEILNVLFASGGLVESVRRSFVELDRSFRASDTLVTKALLGAMGAPMAFDRYVRSGLSCCGLTSQFGRRSVGQAYDFYEVHAEQFRSAHETHAPTYPPFKLLDMYFFQLGMEQG